MANSADPDQLASSQLIWIYTVCKGRVYLGSAGQELITLLFHNGSISVSTFFVQSVLFY